MPTSPDGHCAAPARMAADPITQALPAMVAFWRSDLTCAFANGAYGEWFGRSSDQMLGCHMSDLMGPRLFAQNEPHIRAALEGSAQKFERTLIKADGAVGHTLASYLPQRDEAGTVIGFIAQVVDITPIEETRRALSLAALVFDSMVEGVIVADLDSRIVSVNRAFTAITGYAPVEAIGQTTHFLGLDRDDERFRAELVRVVATEQAWRGDMWSRRKDGRHFLAEQTTTLAFDRDGQPTHYVSIFHDVTEARRGASQLRRQALHDILTGLPNRAALRERIQDMTGGDGAPFTLLFLDLDGFKPINDRHGHDAGDQVLREIARRLTSLLRPGDMAARFAGDEFVVLVEDAPDQDAAAAIAVRIEREFGEPVFLDGAAVTVGVSIGTARYPADGRTKSELLAHADIAMYAVKRSRRFQNAWSG